MTQVICEVTLEKFTHALNHARRRFPLVDANCHHEGTVATKVGKCFHRYFPNHSAPGRHPGGRRGRELQFAQKYCKLRLVYQLGAGSADSVVGGYCVLDGEILSLWNVEKGRGDWMLQHAIADGGHCCDSFDQPALVSLYLRNGFRCVLREPNDPKRCPTGGPDVLFWRHSSTYGGPVAVRIKGGLAHASS